MDRRSKFPRGVERLPPKNLRIFLGSHGGACRTCVYGPRRAKKQQITKGGAIFK